MEHPETSLDKVKDDIEGFSDVKESLSFLKEEIEFTRDNPAYKALYDKEHSLKNKIPNFDTFEGLSRALSSVTSKKAKHDIIGMMAVLPNVDNYIKRMNIRKERLKLHDKLRKNRKNKKNKIEN